MVLAESMSFGLPIAAMRNTGSAEVLAEGEHGILTPNADVDALYTAIEPLLQDVDQRAAYAQKSLQRVEDFKIAPILAQWEAVFQQKI